MVDSLVVSAQLILAWICISLAECVMTCEPGQVKAPELVDPATRMAALQKQKEALEHPGTRGAAGNHGDFALVPLECSSMFGLHSSFSV